ncbi:MAG: hypothetical protein QOD42_1258 [Sphingomonadales bacterium]|jgi:endonuclease G|nr:hypothetical protein [Sphingomonadales bacterium]
MATPAQDRTAVWSYLDRLSRELGNGDAGQSGEAPPAGEEEWTEDGLRRQIGEMAADPEVDDAAVKSFEARVRKVLRPMIQLDRGEPRFEASETAPWRARLLAGRATLARVSAAVGRIVLRGHPSLSWVGSAFHVGAGLVLTTRHIAAILTEATGEPALRAGLSVAIEVPSPDGTAIFAVAGVALIHPTLDIAILRLEDSSPTPPRLTFDGSEEIARDLAIGSFGYAGVANSDLDPERPTAPPGPTQMVAIGRITGYEHAQILDEKIWCLAHDCSTLPGFSGGPLVDLESGLVLGVNFASQASAAGLLDGGGYAIPASELARDPRLRALGLEFTPNSPPPDPDPAAETAASPELVESPPADAMPDSKIEAVERALAKQYRSEKKLVAFIESLGEDYAQGVAAQPGRGRGEPEAYRRALVIGLYRRGLIDKAFLERLGLNEDGPADAPPLGEAPASAEGDLSLRAVRRISKRLKLSEMPPRMQEAVLLGSPHWEQFTQSEDRPPPIDKLVERLARDGSEDSRAALAWLLDRLEGRGNIPSVDGRPGLELETLVPKRWEMLELSYFRQGGEAARSVGRLIGKLGGSTCWLLAPDIVVAPGNVLNGRPPDPSTEAPIEEVDHAALGFVVEFEGDEGARVRRVGVREVAFIDKSLDLMLLRLKRRVVDRLPLQIRSELVTSGPIASIHYPNLGRKMISIHGGRLLANDGHETKYLLATAPGVGGAPIFDTNWQVIATHRGWSPLRRDAAPGWLEMKIGTSVIAMIQRLRNAPNMDRLWRQIVGSQQALRTIDPNLRGESPRRERQPITIELIDADTPLDRIPGLKPISRLGRIVTASATPGAVERLAVRQGVVAVEASRGATAPECIHSLPHIGIPQVRAAWEETGDRALIAVIDNGIDIHHDTFLDAAGQVRIVAFWDQQDQRGLPEEPAIALSPAGEAFVQRYKLQGGAVYVADDIAAIRAGQIQPPPSFPSAADMSHGTVVCSIAAGRKAGNAAQDFTGGIAPDAKLVVIRYDLKEQTVGYSGGHVSALTFIDKLATDQRLPVVVNISNGMNGGAHDGTSKVEVACAIFSKMGQEPGRVVVKSAGNERQRNRHAELSVPAGAMKPLRFFYDAHQDARPGTSAREQIELWLPYPNTYIFTLVTPSGYRTPPLRRDAPELKELLPNGNLVKANYFGLMSENTRSLLQIQLFPKPDGDIEPGAWKIEIKGDTVRTNDPIHAWIEMNSIRTIQFMDNPEERCTITVPGTTQYVITVGAVEVNADLIAQTNSSMGPTLANVQKPDLVAPGVAIVGAGAGSRSGAEPFARFGTSLAAPHVAGSIALVLSAWAKKSEPDGIPNQTVIRRHLLDSSAWFSVEGDHQLGHGRLDAAAFFEASRPRLGAAHPGARR